eukprot:TRINITY_DN2654_c0_g1_i2.p1 TRINITY_DN2654_c0_g1~~TRINITY_DN2654_c0_g1_i2.p1  ORF type:complete len:599 (-),score=59.24 TRINITY_DN2654_c0_g1_i2:496-2220(-)
MSSGRRFLSLACIGAIGANALVVGDTKGRGFEEKAASSAVERRPNILYIMLDDLGWADVGWHRPAGYEAVKTPNMDALAREGVELDRLYAYKICSPTRSAIQAGRNPIHVNVLNLPRWHRYAGVPEEMTSIAELLRAADYETHIYGKWHAGASSDLQTPHGRGYDHSLVFLDGSIDKWRLTKGYCKANESVSKQFVVDLWEDWHPAYHHMNPMYCEQGNHTDCTYADELFYRRVIGALDRHRRLALTKPFFIFWSAHVPHAPLQAPDWALHEVAAAEEGRGGADRHMYAAMVHFLDDRIGKVVKKLHADGLWENTLIVLQADNGGHPKFGASNYPLRGGKATNWEGGIRVAALAAGGFLPKAVQGTKQAGLMATWDWYATFAHLAGLPRERVVQDRRAASAGLPPVDSFNLWPLLSGQTTTSPRKELVIGDALNSEAQSPTLVGGLLRGRYKILFGELKFAGWHSSTGLAEHLWDTRWCGRTPSKGCLFDVIADPAERHNLAEEFPDLFEEMLGVVDKYQEGVFSPDRGEPCERRTCLFALGRYHGIFGPTYNTSGEEVPEDCRPVEHPWMSGH